MGWVTVYFDRQHHNQHEALYMIHCEPVMFDVYKGNSKKEHQRVAEMISHALKSHNSCERNLAIKNYFVFDNLFWIRGTDLHHQIKSEIEHLLGMPPDKVRGSLSHYNWEDISNYCRKVEYELQSLIRGNDACFGRCKKVDLAVMEQKAKTEIDALRKNAEVINRFIELVGHCDDNAEKHKFYVRKISSETLNLREKPSIKSMVSSKLQKGALLMVLDVKKDWYQVVDDGCHKGWVAGYLTKSARMESRVFDPAEVEAILQGSDSE